jgi:2-polyprenyl-3-methyl-5-hydroxy-6-metoxy-1,4-benzoquinol methylase
MARFFWRTLLDRWGMLFGADAAGNAVIAAREGAEVRTLTNVSFRHGDPPEMIFDKKFDVIVGRWVIMVASDKVDFIPKLSEHLRPGGLSSSKKWTGRVRLIIPARAASLS